MSNRSSAIQLPAVVVSATLTLDGWIGSRGRSVISLFTVSRSPSMPMTRMTVETWIFAVEVAERFAEMQRVGDDDGRPIVGQQGRGAHADLGDFAFVVADLDPVAHFIRPLEDEKRATQNALEQIGEPEDNGDGADAERGDQAWTMTRREMRGST